MAVFQPFVKADQQKDHSEVTVEMLYACHDRVGRQCETLSRLAQHLLANGSDVAAQQAATAVLRYFDLAAPQHHADEELDVFPAILNATTGNSKADVAVLIDHLLQDHRTLESLWEHLSIALNRVAHGLPAQLNLDTLNAFLNCYRNHIDLENQLLFAKLNQLLPNDEIASIGRAMRHRRGIVSV